MYVTPEQIQAVSKADSEAVLAVATAQFAAFEKLASLNASATATRPRGSWPRVLTVRVGGEGHGYAACHQVAERSHV